MAMSVRRNRKTKTEDCSSDIDPEDIVNAIVFFRTERLPDEKKVLIEINAVDSPHRFFFNYLGPQYGDVFMKTMDEIQFDYRSTNRVYAISKGRLRMGMACIVKFMNVFFRGVCIDVNDEFVEVFTIDYGKKVITLMEGYDSNPLFWLRRKFKKMPCQAIPGQLYKVFPKDLNWSQEAADFLLEKMADKEIYAEIARPELPGETISMTFKDPDSDRDIDQCLVSAGHAVYVGEAGLQMIDEEVLSQKIYDHQTDKKVEVKVEEPKPEPLLPLPGASSRRREKPDKPVTFDNMLEALDHSSISSTSSSSSSRVISFEDLSLIDAVSSLALTSQPSIDSAELATELPTALVRPSMRSGLSQGERCENSCDERDGRADGAGDGEERRESEAVSEEIGESSMNTIERLLSIDTSTISCPTERSKLRAELQREMDALKLKLAQLDVKINNSNVTPSSRSSSESSAASQKTPFNPNAAPFVPRSFNTSKRASFVLTDTQQPHSPQPLVQNQSVAHGQPVTQTQLLVQNQFVAHGQPVTQTRPLMQTQHLVHPEPCSEPQPRPSLPSPLVQLPSILTSEMPSSLPPNYPRMGPPMPPQPPGFMVMPPPGFSNAAPVFLQSQLNNFQNVYRPSPWHMN